MGNLAKVEVRNSLNESGKNWLTEAQKNIVHSTLQPKYNMLVSTLRFIQTIYYRLFFVN